MQLNVLWLQWAASSSVEASEEIAGGSKDSIAVDTPTEAAKPESKLAKAEAKASKPEAKAAKPEAKAAKTEAKSAKTEAESDDAASTPPTRRRASADAAGSSHTPDRKKRRLTRPRKLWGQRSARPRRTAVACGAGASLSY